MRRQPAELLRLVCVHIGVPFDRTHYPGLDKRVLPGPERAMPANVAAYLKQDLRPVYEALAVQFPAITARWMAGHYA